MSSNVARLTYVLIVISTVDYGDKKQLKLVKIKIIYNFVLEGLQFVFISLRDEWWDQPISHSLGLLDTLYCYKTDQFDSAV